MNDRPSPTAPAHAGAVFRHTPRAVRRAPRAAAHGPANVLRVWPRLARRLSARAPASVAPWVGYVVAVLSVALVTVVIGVILRAPPHIGNISMLYLLPVLFLGALFGSGPAVLASLLAFLAFDYFFVPPLHRLDVSSPTEWSSLGLLLATALVTGQLTAALRTRSNEARQRQHQAETLYELARTIASVADLDALLPAIAARVVTLFAPAGLAACSILLPDGQGQLAERVLAPSDGPAAEALGVHHNGRLYLARDAYTRGVPRGVSHADGPGSAPLRANASAVVYFTPLRGSAQVVGVLGIAGSADVRNLVVANRINGRESHPLGSLVLAGASTETGAPYRLFEAVRGQIALAIERDALRHAAVHAEALRESDRLKDALLGSVTHDLRTPLAAIKAITSGLAQPGVPWNEAEWRDHIAAIDGSVDRLSRLVSNLLDLSRLEAGVAAPRLDWHLPGEVVAAVLDRLELAGQLAGRSIRLDLPPALPLVPIDHEQIEQVLTNLIENALKYSPASAPVSVSARVLEPEQALEVRVADDGIGVPAEELEAIFGKFYRVRRAEIPWERGRPPAGTGLGLAICQSIVQAHGGRIWAESLPGHGTTIVFTLPVPADTPRGELPELAASSAGAGPEPGCADVPDSAAAGDGPASANPEVDHGA